MGLFIAVSVQKDMTTCEKERSVFFVSVFLPTTVHMYLYNRVCPTNEKNDPGDVTRGRIGASKPTPPNADVVCHHRSSYIRSNLTAYRRIEKCKSSVITPQPYRVSGEALRS